MKGRLSKIRYLFRVAFRQADLFTYHPDKPRKPRFRIFLDLLKIHIIANEISKVYFIRGGDLLNSKWCEFPYREVRKLRDRVNPTLAKEQIEILMNKQKFQDNCRQNNLRTPENYGIVENGAVKWATEPMPGSMIMIKDIAGEKGANVFKVEYIGNNRILDDGQQHDICSRFNSSKTYIVQEVIEQHEIMEALNPSSVNTLRIISSLKNGGTIHAIMLKVGGIGNIYDNWHDKGIIAKVDTSSWAIDEQGYYKFAKYDKISSGIVTVLPANKVLLKDVVIPFRKEIERLVFQAHAMVPDIQSVGWDVAIDAQGPILIEGNHNWGFLDLIQVFYGHEIISEIFDVPMNVLEEKAICFN